MKIAFFLGWVTWIVLAAPVPAAAEPSMNSTDLLRRLLQMGEQRPFSASPGKETSTSGDSAVPTKEGKIFFRHLKVNAKVDLKECDGNPRNCLCPTGSAGKIFWESGSFEAAPKKTLMCVPDCSKGQLLRRRSDPKTGSVSFACLAPSEVGK